jgi:hypothetical protein
MSRNDKPADMSDSRDGDVGRTSADQDDRIPRRGDQAEQAVPESDAARGSDRGGSAGWGSEGAGGSVIDKRSPTKDPQQRSST